MEQPSGRPRELPDEEWGEVLGLPYKRTDDLVEILSGVKIFDILSDEELRQVERIVHRRTYHPQEVIVRQGDPGVGMYIIQSGSANVLLKAGEDRTIRLATLGPGQFFGEMSLLDGAPRAASVVSVERSLLIGFFQADLMDLIDSWPRLGFKIVLRISQLMNGRLRETLAEYRGVRRDLRSRAAAEQEVG
jgi:CRP-like cAMP-binding protein